MKRRDPKTNNVMAFLILGEEKYKTMKELEKFQKHLNQMVFSCYRYGRQ